MEHRWGRRLDSRLRVRIGGAVLGAGRLRDISLSGAFICLPRPDAHVDARLTIEWRVPGTARVERVPASIVRVTDDGFGVEWQDFAPAGVCALLDAVESAPDLSQPAAARRPCADPAG